jgi:hypothetical protein
MDSFFQNVGFLTSATDQCFLRAFGSQWEPEAWDPFFEIWRQSSPPSATCAALLKSCSKFAELC